MRFGSVCSGIEAASVAWHPLGWTPAWFAEIEAFPSAVLAHHYPGVPNLGDMAALPDMIALGTVDAPDILCGGTPCQAFSVAGLRRSLDDARGNLSLTFCTIANAIDDQRRADGQQPCIVFWENVPGVLNTKDNAFGCFLAGLAGEDEPLQPAGGRWSDAGAVFGPARAVAWRVLDAQYFGLAQRRKRVFVVASARDDFDPAQVLFEWQGLRRDTAPSREEGEGSAGTLAGGARKRGGYSTDDTPAVAFGGNNTAGPIDVATACNAHGGAKGRLDFESETFVTQAAHAFDARQSGVIQYGDKAGPLDTDGHSVGVLTFDPTQVTSTTNRSNPQPGDPCHTLAKGAHAPAIAFDIHGVPATAGASETDLHTPLRARALGGSEASTTTAVMQGVAVRRLTPRECERLQGFPDDYTLIPYRKKPAADGPRYKALGNSWAVPVVRWIGARISNHLNAIA